MGRHSDMHNVRVANLQKGTTRVNWKNTWGMPNPRWSHLKSPAELRIPGKLLAYAVLVEGGSYQKIADIFHHCGIHVVGRSAFDAAQKTVAKELIKMGKESMKLWKSRMVPGSIICLDGNWDHKRQGKHCLVSVIDNVNWKIIDCEILKRGVEGERGVNHFKDSTTMEIHAIDILAERLKDIQDKVIGFCHDCDSKVDPVFKKHGWDIQEFLDINHAMLCFVRSFNSINVCNDKCLDGLLVKLKLWTYHCIHMMTDVETKLKYYYNAANHYTGDHSQCEHEKDHPDFVNDQIDDPHTKEVILKFLKDNEYIIKQCNPVANTQHNESFNNTRACKALKSISWKDSYEARVMASILEVNSFDEDWKAELRKKLNLPDLPPKCIEYFAQRRKQKIERQKMRAASEWKEAERIRRLLGRKRLTDMSKNVLQYNVKHIPKFHMSQDETSTIIENMRKSPFRDFIEEQFADKNQELKEFAKKFIYQKNFKYWEYTKQFFNFCSAAFGATQKEIATVYDNILVNYFDELTIDQVDTAEEMIRMNDGPNMLTKHAWETLPDSIPEPPNDVPEFASKSVKIGDNIEQKLLFPRCKNTISAIKQVEGLIISNDEVPNYPKPNVFPISGSNHAIVMRRPLPRSIDYNCEIVFYKKVDQVAAFLRKADKIYFAPTGRYRTVKVSSGMFVTVDSSFLYK